MTNHTDTLNAATQIALLKTYSSFLAIAATSKTAEQHAYDIENATYAALDRRIANALITLSEDENWDGDPANPTLLAYVHTLHGTPFETNEERTISPRPAPIPAIGSSIIVTAALHQLLLAVRTYATARTAQETMSDDLDNDTQARIDDTEYNAAEKLTEIAYAYGAAI